MCEKQLGMKFDTTNSNTNLQEADNSSLQRQKVRSIQSMQRIEEAVHCMTHKELTRRPQQTGYNMHTINTQTTA